MPDPMNETTRPPETQPANRELLDVENQGGIAGRILYATQFPPADGIRYLNPKEPITDMPHVDPNTDRNYNFITDELSKGERDDAWKDQKDLKAAYEQIWRPKFTHAVNDRDSRKAVIKAIIGKDAADIADITEKDVDDMYDKYCRGKSDITAYVSDVITGFTQGDKVNEEEIKEKMEDIQWVASKFFGSQSSEIAVIVAKVEVILKNQQQETLAKFYTMDRLNKLEGSEGKLLEAVFQSLREPTPATPAAGTPAAGAAPTPTPGEIPAAPPATTPEARPAGWIRPNTSWQILERPDGKSFSISSIMMGGGPARYTLTSDDGETINVDENQLNSEGWKLGGQPSGSPFGATTPPSTETGGTTPEPDTPADERDRNPATPDQMRADADEFGKTFTEEDKDDVLGGEEAYIDPELLEQRRRKKEQEEEPIALYYSKEEGLNGLTDSVIRHVGEHQGEQNVAFRMSISGVLPQFIPLVLRALLENPEKPGVVDFVGLDEKKPIIRDVQIKDGDRLRFVIKNIGDRKGIELEAEEGEPGDDVKKALIHFTPLMFYSFNTPLQKVYPLWEVRRIYLEGEGEEMYLRMEVTPVESVPVAQPLPDKDTPSTAPDGSPI